ncbi:hypothetical protein LEN26_016591 [Aphanomyces euteiches]|nr:hypothetical protein LEN26_016591 [Aphanomyces euteiches]
MIRGTRPKIASLKVFGCVCWRRNTAQDKTASRANKCIFLGYSETKKAYKVYDVEERKVTYTVDCTFNETEFLWPKVVFVDDIEEPGDSTTHPKDDTKADVDMNESSPPSTTSLENTNAPTQPKAPVRFPNVPFAYYPPPVRIHDTRASRRAAAAAHTQDELPASPRETNETSRDGRYRSCQKCGSSKHSRKKRSTTYNIPHREGVTAQPARKKHERGQSPTKTMRTYNTRGIATQLPEQSPSHVDDARDAANLVYDICFNATDIDEDVPATFHEAMQSQDAAEWLEACKKEIGNLKSMGCYELSHAPSGKQALKSKWVFKRKDMPDGQKIFKARVVIKGFAQRQGLDYDETYAPVICGDSLRLVLAIVAIADMKCRQ